MIPEVQGIRGNLVIRVIRGSRVIRDSRDLIRMVRQIRIRIKTPEAETITAAMAARKSKAVRSAKAPEFATDVTAPARSNARFATVREHFPATSAATTVIRIVRATKASVISVAGPDQMTSANRVMHVTAPAITENAADPEKLPATTVTVREWNPVMNVRAQGSKNVRDATEPLNVRPVTVPGSTRTSKAYVYA